MIWTYFLVNKGCRATRGAAGPTGDPELRQDLLRALATLPRMKRAVLVLRYFEDRPTHEVAEMPGIPVGTVTSHASRGLEALRLSSHLSDTEDDA